MHVSPARTFLYLLATSFLVGALAFVNRYPLVYFDTHAYVQGMFELKPLWDRPMGYPFMMRAVTWLSTLWTVVIFQGLLVSWLLLEWLRALLPPRIVVWKVHLLLLLVLVLCTSMPWYAAQIMPDIFAPITALALGLLLFVHELVRWKRALLWILLFFFLLAHYSFAGMTILLLMGLTAWKSWRRWRGGAPVPVHWSNIAGVAGVLFSGMLFTIGYNAVNGLGAVYSPAANCFFAGRLCEGEVMADFLRAHCPDKDYALCPYKEELPRIPGEFLWAENSMVARLGGASAAEKALDPVISDLLLDVGSLGAYLQTAIKDTFVQLFQVDTGSGIVKLDEEENTCRTLLERLPGEGKMYLVSLQYYNAWRFEGVNRVIRIVLLLSVILIAWHWNTTPTLLKHLVLLLLAWVFLNALVTASLANVYDRLQSRVAWLVVLVACLMLMRTAWGERMVSRAAPKDT